MIIEPGEGDVRRYPRMMAEYSLTYRPISSDPKENHRAKTKTIGMGGIMFEHDNFLPVGLPYHLKLKIGKHTIAVMGKVAYARHVSEEVYQIGMEYVDLSKKDREILLAEFMKSEYNIHPGKK